MSRSTHPRVLVVPSSYLSRARTIGGGERYAAEYARALSRLTPTTLALFDRTADRAVEDSLELRTFELSREPDGLLFPLSPAGRREVSSYDIVHLMMFPTPLADLLLLLSRLNRQTVVLTDVGGGIPTLSTYLRKVHPRLDLNRLADGLALLSEQSARQFAGWSQPRTLLYGGAKLPEMSEEPADPYALFVGRLLPHKGVLELIESLPEGTPLHVVGRPYDTAYLERLKQAAEGKQVSFFLDADDEELDRQYRGARIVLQPSIPVRSGPTDTSELLGLVTLEGMSYGKPVIVTRTASLPELVRDGQTGFIVPPGDREALRTRIGELMGDDDLRRRIGAAARSLVEAEFTWERVASRGLEFYEELRGVREPATAAKAKDPVPAGEKERV